ncbi:transketolase family protein [Enterococcus faecalis]
MFDKTDQLGVNTIRTLSIEAVQKANSGHPGLPMGAAPMAYALWTKHLKVNPTTSRNWVDRDRFVLSAGHGSAMLYSLLHLSGYNVTIDDLKNFRQWDSKTPGHPEVHHTDGVEATTGPLGQGIAMAVGMAMAEAHLAATYNRDSFPIMDHYTYAICGDGDLMEGVSQEASSMAGHMKLGKLIVLYDSNDISLDGPTSKAFTENVGARYEAYGWQHILVKDGNDLDEIEAAIEAAKAVYGWEYPDFTVPEEVAARFKETMIDEGQKAEEAWNEMFKNYEHAHPELAKQFKEAFANQLPEGWEQELPKYELGTSAASRVTSKETIQAISKVVPSFWGGSADLSASNNTMVAAEKDFEPGQYEGRNIWFGVREFAMAAAMNGIQLHGGSHVYGGTFFVFTDYLRPAIRLAALQKVPVTYVLTHDSVAVGEDGPTHEPIEQLASVRCIPNVHVIRPADGNETVAAWKIAMTSTETPTILVLSRQNLPVLEGTLEHASDSVQKGAYVLSPQKGEQPSGILIATGSEVNLAVEAQAKLAEEGIDVSVVSMPSFDLFEKQSAEYKESVLPKAVTKRVAIEAAASFGWERYVGTEGKTITIDHFGASAPGGLVLEKFGFTPENVVNTYKSL